MVLALHSNLRLPAPGCPTGTQVPGEDLAAKRKSDVQFSKRLRSSGFKGLRV